MARRITPLWLGLCALAAHAEAKPECIAPIYVWELQLEQVAADAGQPDLRAVATALGTAAVLRGGHHDPVRPDDPVHVELIGSTDGAGLNVGLENAP